MGSGVVTSHKYCLLEIQECFETYCIRKDLAEQSLEFIKSSIKQQSLADDGTTYPAACSEEQVNLTEYMSLVVRKLVFGVSDQVPHKPGCTATEDG